MPTNAAWPNEVAPPMPVSSTRPSATSAPMPMSLSSETREVAEQQRRERDRGDDHRDQQRDCRRCGVHSVDLLFFLLGVRR